MKEMSKKMQLLVLVSLASLVLSSPHCPGGEDWCDDPIDYNHTRIEAALAKSSPLLLSSPGHRRVVRQVSGQQAQVPACPALRKFTTPTLARNQAGNFLPIVNTAEYEQHIQITTCSAWPSTPTGWPSHPSHSVYCGQAGMFSPFNTSCVQEYMIHRLVAVNEEDEVVLGTFSFPSACNCYFQKPSP